MLIEDYIEMKIINTNIDYYHSLGYECKYNDIILVSTKDLPSKSHKKERRICDCCGKEYIRQHNQNIVSFNAWGKDICSECSKKDEFIKIKQSKIESTSLKRYGVKVGLQLDEIKNKQRKTMLERYGVEFPGQCEEFKEKIKNTCIKKYGGTNPMASEEVRSKMRSTLYKNGNVPTSSQQIDLKKIIENLYKDEEVILNYPVSTTSLDIALHLKNGIKIDIEYDGSHWHSDEQKDRRRDEFLKSKGYKILRIRSGHLLPEENVLIEHLNLLIDSDYCFTEIILSDWK